MLPGSMPEYSQYLEVAFGNALSTSGGFSSLSYRPEFDVSVPVFSPLAAKLDSSTIPQIKSWLVTSSQSNIPDEFREQLSEIASEQPRFLLLDRCTSKPLDVTLKCNSEDEVYAYPQVLQNSSFCLVLRGVRLGIL